ncbi:hypothetical protein JB92DRAFT_81159 [Gautieria morchelliformis]|nr:hypothetical protein JB92DRAFT_81159 [Gautieria morchelliformis]
MVLELMPQHQLLVLVRDSKVTEHATVASTALLYYDTVLTFSDEVEYVWGQRLSWGRIIYLIIRYLSLFAQTFNTAVALDHTAGLDRVWLLYNRSLTLLFSLGFVYMTCFTAVTVLTVLGLLHKQMLSRPGPFLSGCFTSV